VLPNTLNDKLGALVSNQVTIDRNLAQSGAFWRQMAQNSAEWQCRAALSRNLKFCFLDFLNVQKFCGKSNHMQDKYFD
jgi:hypothetical protein